jgi:acetyltransferase-like isoleucine patch superfamily enzyme
MNLQKSNLNDIPEEQHSKIFNVEFGENVKLIHPVNIYGAKIGENTFIGPFIEIQKNVKIGKSCKIQSHTFICELVEIGDNCFIGHGVMFVNDLFTNGMPANGDKNLWKETHIGNNVSIGSNATILPVRICEGTVIGAGAVVVKDITRKGIYVGNPAKLIRAL